MNDTASDVVNAATPKPRLFDVVRERLRVKHYSLRTERSYLQWIRRFILFHGKRHPRDLGPREIEAFLSHLATNRDVAASTQNQALAALLFLYREGSGIELLWLENIVRPRRHHMHEQALQRAITRAVTSAGICKPASTHTLRHSFATHARSL